MKKLENSGAWGSKNEPGSVRATQNRVPTARFERQNAKKSREAHRFFFLRVRTSLSERESARCGPGQGATALRTPKVCTVISIEIYPLAFYLRYTSARVPRHPELRPRTSGHPQTSGGLDALIYPETPLRSYHRTAQHPNLATHEFPNAWVFVYQQSPCQVL